MSKVYLQDSLQKIETYTRKLTYVGFRSGCGFKENMTLSSHKNFVACVCVLPPSKKFSNELIVTGSNDKAIRLFDITQTDPITVLNDHTSTGIITELFLNILID